MPVLWSPSLTPRVVGDELYPSTGNAGYRYRCVVAGAVGALEPAWPLVVGEAVADGVARYVTDLEPTVQGPQQFRLNTPITAPQWAPGVPKVPGNYVVPVAVTWTPLTPYPINTIVVATAGAASWRYLALNAGASGAAEPVWPVVAGQTVVDGGITWRCTAASDKRFRCLIGGNTGGAEPTWPTQIGTVLAEGGGSPVVWMTELKQPGVQFSRTVENVMIHNKTAADIEVSYYSPGSNAPAGSFILPKDSAITMVKTPVWFVRIDNANTAGYIQIAGW